MMKYPLATQENMTDPVCIESTQPTKLDDTTLGKACANLETMIADVQESSKKLHEIKDLVSKLKGMDVAKIGEGTTLLDLLETNQKRMMEVYTPYTPPSIGNWQQLIPGVWLGGITPYLTYLAAQFGYYHPPPSGDRIASAIFLGVISCALSGSLGTGFSYGFACSISGGYINKKIEEHDRECDMEPQRRSDFSRALRNVADHLHNINELPITRDQAYELVLKKENTNGDASDYSEKLYRLAEYFETTSVDPALLHHKLLRRVLQTKKAEIETLPVKTA